MKLGERKLKTLERKISKVRDDFSKVKESIQIMEKDGFVLTGQNIQLNGIRKSFTLLHKDLNEFYVGTNSIIK